MTERQHEEVLRSLTGVFAERVKRPPLGDESGMGDALASVRGAGAVRAMVSGSGPTVIGIFTGDDGSAHARAAAATIAERHPGAVAAEPVGRAYAAARPA